MSESTVVEPMRFEGRLLEKTERDHVEALDGRFRPASKRNLQLLARIGVEETAADELGWRRWRAVHATLGGGTR